MTTLVITMDTMIIKPGIAAARNSVEAEMPKIKPMIM